MEKLTLNFFEDSIAQTTDFNAIEDKIEEVTTKLFTLGYTISSYTKETWQKGMVLYNARLNNIETGIKNIGKAYFRPYGWQNDKFWTEGMSFSYKDMNRWINNLNLIIDRLNNESSSLFPSDTLYPSETLLPH